MTEGPYKLPESWRWVRLGEACEINPRRPRLYVDPNEPTTFVPMTAVDDQAGTIATPEVRPFKQVQKGYTYFEEGDVLFAKITPCMENGKAAIVRGSLNGFGFGSTEFHVLRPGGSVIPEWIWLFIRQERFRKAAKDSFRGGVGQQRVPKKFLQQHPIPLPPIEEQRRIVARVEELIERVREAKRLRQQVMEDAERLWQSTLAETFPRPGAEPPPGWRWVRLGEVCNLYQPKTITVQEMKRNPGPYPVFGANGIIGNYYQFNHEESEVIVTCRGATCGTVNMSLPRSWITGNAMVATPAIEGLRKDYLYWAIKSTDLRKAIGGSAQPQITRLTLSPMIIPLPPLEEQRQIVSHLKAVQEKIKILKEIQATTDAELQRLEQAILDSAFRGEL